MSGETFYVRAASGWREIVVRGPESAADGDVAVFDGPAGTRLRSGGPVEAFTWTPTIAFETPGTSSIAYTNQYGNGFRIGPFVYCMFDLAFTPTIGTGSGDLVFGGLPYAVKNVTGGKHWGGTCTRFNPNFDWPSGSTQTVTRLLEGTSTFNFIGLAPASGATTFGVSELTGGSACACAGYVFYLTDA